MWGQWKKCAVWDRRLSSPAQHCLLHWHWHQPGSSQRGHCLWCTLSLCQLLFAHHMSTHPPSLTLLQLRSWNTNVGCCHRLNHWHCNWRFCITNVWCGHRLNHWHCNLRFCITNVWCGHRLNHWHCNLRFCITSIWCGHRLNHWHCSLRFCITNVWCGHRLNHWHCNRRFCITSIWCCFKLYHWHCYNWGPGTQAFGVVTGITTDTATAGVLYNERLMWSHILPNKHIHRHWN